MARTHFWRFHQSALWKVFHLDDHRESVKENIEHASKDLEAIKRRIDQLEGQVSKLCITIYVLLGCILAFLIRLWS